jgi:hypothetical protein
MDEFDYHVVADVNKCGGAKQVVRPEDWGCARFTSP